MRLCLLFVMLAITACASEGGEEHFDAGVEEAVGQGSFARGDLVINEVMAKPASGPDWIELYNRSDRELDLCDFFVTDSLARLDHYLHLGAAPPPASCVPTPIAAGAYRIVYADDDVTAGPEHAPFKLGTADEVHVVSMSGEALDSLIYLQPKGNSGRSLARIPNGEGLFWLGQPSEGNENPSLESE